MVIIHPSQGTPSANFPDTNCDLTSHFVDNNILINLTLCRWFLRGWMATQTQRTFRWRLGRQQWCITASGCPSTCVGKPSTFGCHEQAWLLPRLCEQQSIRFCQCVLWFCVYQDLLVNWLYIVLITLIGMIIVASIYHQLRNKWDDRYLNSNWAINWNHRGGLASDFKHTWRSMIS